MAEKNYYLILNVPSSSTTEEIRHAYRNLALKFHPDKNDKPGAEERFKDIAEAHSVLSNEERRREYDRSREVTLLFRSWKKTCSEDFGGPEIPFQAGPGFQTTFESHQSQGFTSDFFDDAESLTEMMNDFIIRGSDRTNPRKTRAFEEQFFHDTTFNTSPNKKFKRQDPVEERDLYLSLEELFTGATKTIQIIRKVYNQFGNFSLEEKFMLVKIMPGWKEGTKITFSSEGDRKPGVEPADVVFKLKDKTHEHFSRDSENNLIYICKMSLRDALIGTSVDIPTIDGKVLRINHDSVVQPGTQKLIKGEGLPRPKNPSTRADLIVKYDIFFPHFLSPHQRQIIFDSLPR